MTDGRTRSLAAVFLVLPFLSVGCQVGPEFAEVEGVVTLNGKPLANVEIVFLPDPELGTLGPRAACYTDEQGHYRLRCERPEKAGTVIGSHRVCVYDITALPAPPDPTTEGTFGGPGSVSGLVAPVSPPLRSRVPTEYGDVSRTPFRNVPVDPGKQTFNFDLRSPLR